MNRKELKAIVKRSSSTTLLAARMREALGLPPLRVTHESKPHGHTGKRKRYRGVRKLMKQRYGVKL